VISELKARYKAMDAYFEGHRQAFYLNLILWATVGGSFGIWLSHTVSPATWRYISVVLTTLSIAGIVYLIRMKRAKT